jgi:phage shock protein PspC (stress-responsive transcriptional regulator)
MVRRASTRDGVRMNPTSSPRDLTRSTTDKKVGGVAGGLAAYFGVDALLVRIGFAVTTLFSGAGLIAYVALLAFVPTDDHVPAVAHAAAA